MTRSPTATPIDPVLDAAPAGFLSVDEAGIVLTANTTLAQLVGVPRERIEGRSMDVLLSAAGQIFYTTHLFPLLRLHERADEVYVPLRDARGDDIPVLVSAASRRRDGRAVYDLVIVPMPRRSELESELLAARRVAEQAASAKDRFLSIVSHELRTPLTAVSGYADLLLRERRGPLNEDQRRYVMRIKAAAGYTATLIEDVLDFARQTGGRRPVRPVVIPLEDVLTRAESLLSVRAREQGRSLRREPAPAPGTVRADPAAIQQILLNLLTNALKFSPAGAEVRLTAEQDGDVVRIGVHDSGSGIPEGDLERIFEPFVQLFSEGEPDAARGVGLGLPISRELARSMGGDITVRSVVGEGSTFTLHLPAGGAEDAGPTG